MPSLDGYSLNEKIDKVHEEIKGELLLLRNEFTELYAYMKKYNAIKDVKVKIEEKKKPVEKVLEVTESEE